VKRAAVFAFGFRLSAFGCIACSVRREAAWRWFSKNDIFYMILFQNINSANFARHKMTYA